MKSLLTALLLTLTITAQAWTNIPHRHPVADTLAPDTSPTNRAALMQKLVALPCGILPADTKAVVLQKLNTWLTRYQLNPAYPDDRFAKAANQYALKGVLTGGYGIGAVLVDQQGRILHGAHNQQLQTGRSDLHGEMALLTEFESKSQFRKYRRKAGFTGAGSTIYTEPLTLYTSAEPCPMCFIRVAIVGIETRYVTTGPDDGMNARAACLPKFWYELSQKHTTQAARCAPVLQQMAHCLFFSFLL